MSLENVRKALVSIGNSTATKHPKVLIAELCGVLRALVKEIDRIDKEPVSILKPAPVFRSDIEPEDTIRPQKKWKRFADNPVVPPPPKLDPQNRPRNAGDAE